MNQSRISEASEVIDKWLLTPLGIRNTKRILQRKQIVLGDRKSCGKVTIRRQMVSNHFSFAYAVFSSIWVYKAYTINTLIIRSKPQTAQDPLFLVWIYIFLHCIFMFNPSELKKKQCLCSNPLSLWSLTLLVAGWVIEQKLHYQHLELVASGEDQVCDTGLAAAWDAWRQERKILLEKLCSLLAQHIQRYDSSLRTWSHTVTTESLQSSSCAGEHEEMEWWNYLQDYIRVLSPASKARLLLPAPARRNASSLAQIGVRLHRLHGQS